LGSKARNNNFIHDEALCCEFAARFYMRRQQQRFSIVYSKQALQACQQWGADAKVKHLMEEFPQLQQMTKIPINSKLSVTTRELKSSSVGLSMQLDMTSLLKSSQAISSTIILDDLIKILLANVIENTGAQKGFHRSIDIVARYGGEEFVVILSNTNTNQAQEMAEKLRKTVESLQIKHEGNGEKQIVTISIGGNCVIPTSNQRGMSLLRMLMWPYMSPRKMDVTRWFLHLHRNKKCILKYFFESVCSSVILFS
jgi:hypothetical protein